MASWTPKQKRFVAEYCVDCNATQAAIRAGYSHKRANQTGYNLLQDPDIQEAVEERLEELAMSAAEATMRLSEWGRGTLARFLTVDDDGEVVLDLSSAEAQEYLYLIRDLKQTETVLSDDDGEVVLKRTMRVKLHDAKDAVRLILKMHGKFKEHYDITSGGEPITEIRLVNGPSVSSDGDTDDQQNAVG